MRFLWSCFQSLDTNTQPEQLTQRKSKRPIESSACIAWFCLINCLQSIGIDIDPGCKQQGSSERVAQGATIASVELNSSTNPWLAGAGMFSADSLFSEWQQAMDFSQNRNEVV